METMKTITIDGVTYEILDESARNRMTSAETNISALQSGKADTGDIPTKVSDLQNDTGYITDARVEDVKIDGTSIVENKTANIPRASASTAGVIKFDPSTEASTNYVDIYANEQNPSRIPLLDQNNELTANQLPAATTSTKGAMSSADKTKLNTMMRPVASTVTLEVANWSNDTQTIIAEGVTTTGHIIVSPAPASINDYVDAGIYCVAQGEGSLTFTCENTPEVAISVQVLIVAA